MRNISPLVLLLACLLAGCSPVHFLPRPNQPEGDPWGTAVHEHRPDVDVQISPDMRQKMIRMELKEFGKHGAFVRVATESGPKAPSIMGTIHQVTKDELVLFKCITRSIVPGPEGQLQCQTTHTPIMSVKISELTDFSCFTEALENDTSPRSIDDLSAVIGVIYKDGSQQVWGKTCPPDE